MFVYKSILLYHLLIYWYTYWYMIYCQYDLNKFATNVQFSQFNLPFASLGNAWLTAPQITTVFTKLMTHKTVFLKHLIDTLLFLFILMTHDVRDDSHAFLYKKGSEFKPLGLTQLHCMGGCRPDSSPTLQKTVRIIASKGLLRLHQENVPMSFNWTSGEENGMLEHFDLKYKYYCIKHLFFD